MALSNYNNGALDAIPPLQKKSQLQHSNPELIQACGVDFDGKKTLFPTPIFLPETVEWLQTSSSGFCGAGAQPYITCYQSCRSKKEQV